MPLNKPRENITAPDSFLNIINKYTFDPHVQLSRSIDIAAGLEHVFHYVERIGGESGWYTFNWLIDVRRFLSMKFKSHRSGFKVLSIGDRVDMFKVADIEMNKYLILAFENDMLDGVFCFYLEKSDVNITTLYAATHFSFKNTSGKIYWIFVRPFDKILQKRMLINIKKLAEKLNL